MAVIEQATKVDDIQSLVAAGMSHLGRRVYVVSLHYMEKKMRRDYRTRIDSGAWTEYKLEAVRRAGDRPSVMLVMDGYQEVFIGTEDFTRIRKKIQVPEPAIHIANDLIKEASSVPPSGPMDWEHPAVWISECGSAGDVRSGTCKGLMPAIAIDRHGNTVYSSDWDSWGTPKFEAQFPEFFAECQAYRMRQWRFSELKLAQGNAYFDGPQKNPYNINEIHRNAATWVGANAAEYPWIENTRYGSMIPCMWCGHSTSAAHPLCGDCGKVINPMQLARTEKDQEEQVRKYKEAHEPQPASAATAGTPPAGPPRPSPPR